LNNLTEPAIIISASGMADAGRILHHLKHNLWRPECSVVFVGYQAQGSLGRRLLEGAKRVKIMGEDISVRAEIHNLEGFSAHADQDQLLAWLAHFKAKPVNVFIVHGEYDMSEPFSRLIKEKLDYSSYIPHYGDVAVIEGREWHIEESPMTAEPAVKELYGYLEQIETDYRAYRKRLEQLALTDSGRIPDALTRLSKIYKYMKKTLDL
jgi:metallo-beta-lactamase family protein